MNSRRKPRVLLVHPGTQYTKFLVEQLWDSGLLHKLCTSFSAAERTFLARYVLRNHPLRIIHGIPSSAVKLYPWSLIRARVLRKFLKLRNEDYCHEWFGNFQKRVPSDLLKQADIVIGYDTASWILAQRVKELGKTFVLDYSAVPHASLFQLMAKAYPDSKDLKDDLPVHSQQMLDCYQQERDLADYITHASSFSGDCLLKAGVPSDKLVKIPYGVQDSFSDDAVAPIAHQGVRFAYVGRIMLRKGVPFLLEAFSKLGSSDINSTAELHLYGWGGLSDESAIENNPSVFRHGAIAHTEMPKELAKMDVLVLPSIVEGFGLVVLEAMRRGMPVIVSDQVGASDIVVDGESGFVVPAGDSTLLAEAMKFFIDNPSQISVMGKAAKNAAKQMTWQRYGSCWSNFLCGIAEK